MIALSACGFGSISPLTVIATSHGAALQTVQAWRYVTSALLLMVYASEMRATKSSSPLPSQTAAGPWYSPRIILIAGSGQTAVATLALLALRWIPAATSAFLFYTYPAMVAIIAAIRGTERLAPIRVVALLLALGGIATMVGAPSSAALDVRGIVAVITAALIYAFYIPVLASLQHGRAPVDVARAISVGGAMFFVAWALVTGALFIHMDPAALAASVMQGIVAAVAFVCFLTGLSELGPVRTAITSTVEPFWTTMLGVVLLGQPIGFGTLVGGALIMTAVVLLQRPSVSSGRLHSS